MDIRDHGHYPHTTEESAQALGIITGIVIVAGFAMFAAWFALLLFDDWRSAPLERPAGTSCSICGVVERVSEIQPAPPQALEGSRAEGTVILLAALGGAGAPGARPAPIYETSVLHDDGSIRVLRNWSQPHWVQGDRVRVVKGQVEPVAAPAEKTPNPDLRAARVP